MIVKMNKLTFLIYHKEYEAFLEKLRALGVVHVEIRQSGEVDESLQKLLQKHTSYKTLQKEMTSWAHLADEQDKKVTAAQESIEETLEGYNGKQQSIQLLTQQIPALEREIAQLEVWGEFDWNLIDKLKDNGWIIQFFNCPDKSFDEKWQDEYNAQVITRKGGQCYFITVNPAPVELEAEAVRLPKHKLSELINQQQELNKDLEEAKRQLARFCVAHLPVVEAAIDQLQGDIELLEVKLGGEKMADGSVVLLEGWVPVDNTEEVRNMLEANGIYYEIRPAEKEDNAPIKLKNNFVTRLFEVLTKMYGLPDYGEFDPTPMLAPFYALFFGLCVGDAGYGLLLVALGFYLKKKVGQSMQGIMNLLITLGAATTIVGALVGTFFGVELVKLDLPEWIKNVMITGKYGDTGYDKTMIFDLMVGMFHICFAMVVKAVCATARYGFKNALSAWGWLLFVGGSVTIGTLNYLGVITMDAFKTAFIVISAISAIGIYLLNNIRRNVFINVGAGLWDTYNMATGLMGDLLSYLRLYALGLAGGMLGGVFNNLGLQLHDSMADVLWGIPGWICFGLIFVFGHGLNIALSCLSGYVHSIRLTFVEYFKNSGYEGKGSAYKPFSSVHDKE